MPAEWRILEGDCRHRLPELDAGSVQTCVTSPPYFGLRDYGHSGQLGLEPTPDAYVAALVDVFRGVRRVLRDDGTVWLNLGDSYAQYDGQGNLDESREPGQHGAFRVSPNLATVAENRGPGRHSLPPGAKRKDLLGVPWLVAFALRADGWYLRSDIIWAKPNPMPESVTDRPTKAHEYVFLLSKGARYFYDADAIREDDAGQDHEHRNVLDGQPSLEPSNGLRSTHGGLRTVAGRNGAGRNKRSVWTVATQPYPGAHFATFPPKLVEPCILAGCPERACRECGAPWERVVEREPMIVRPTAKREAWQATDEHARTQTGGTMLEPPSSRTLGFVPACGHDATTTPGVVLDPFAGSATTGLVALRHGRSFIGIESNPAYVQLGRWRIVDDAPLLNSVAEVA